MERFINKATKKVRVHPKISWGLFVYWNWQKDKISQPLLKYLFRERALLMTYFRVDKGVHNDPKKWDILEYELLHMVGVKNDLRTLTAI